MTDAATWHRSLGEHEAEYKLAPYAHPLICDECGCFESRHASECSLWKESE